MRPHMCLLVLVLATSVIAGTQDVNPPELESPPPSEITTTPPPEIKSTPPPEIKSTPFPEIKSTPPSEASKKSRFKITKSMVRFGFDTLALATFVAFAVDPHLLANNNDPTTRRSISTTPSTTPPRAFSGREVRIIDHRGLSVDTSEARSFSDNHQKLDASSLDLLNRAHLEEAFRLFSRMLDELD